MTMGLAVEQSDQVSYTFPLIPKEEMTPDILNLVFTVSEGELVGMGVVVYYLTKEQKDALEGITPSEMEAPTGYLALDNEFRSIPFLQTENSGGRHLSTRMAPPDHNENIDFVDGIPLDPVLIEGGGGGGPSSPSFGLPRHPTTNAGSPGMSSGNNSHGGGSSGGATKPVTAPNKVIIDKSFKDNKCLNDIYKELGGDTTIKSYVNHFNGDFADLKLSVSNKLNDDENATTSFPMANNKIEIQFNINNLNRPALDIVRTMIHEVLHATMYRWLLIASETGHAYYRGMSPKEQRNYVNNLRNNFPGLYDYYMDRQPEDWGHEQMAAHFMEPIISAMKEFEPGLPEDTYKALAWSGLKETWSWKEFKTKNPKKVKEYDRLRKEYFSTHFNCQ